ncbi:MAG: hypothetical protein LBF86_08680, partial [Helicobacteraceae bacterium]|nr:hypothetical protein [Helicobacteraceae bacterium]
MRKANIIRSIAIERIATLLSLTVRSLSWSLPLSLTLAIALALLSPSLLIGKELTRAEIERIAKDAVKGVDSWSSDVTNNMQKPLQGDKPLSGLDGKPITTGEGQSQTIDAGLDCAKTSQTELVKVTARQDNATGRYAIKINTNIEGRGATYSQTISGICPNNGYVICS